MPRRIALLIAGMAGVTAIALGAFGAHALREQLLAHHSRGYWNTAVLYHLIHAVALLWAADRASVASGPLLCWGSGILLFCGSLYALALTGIAWLTGIAPVGGLLLMAGWLLVIIRPSGETRDGSKASG